MEKTYHPLSPQRVFRLLPLPPLLLLLGDFRGKVQRQNLGESGHPVVERNMLSVKLYRRLVKVEVEVVWFRRALAKS